MLNRLPKQCPPLSAMLADIGNPSAAAVAKALDVHPRTVARWLADDLAPRPASLALFWLTRWGFSVVDAELFNLAQIAFARHQVAEVEARDLRAELARLLELASFGAANDPTRAPTPPRPRLQLIRA